MDLESLPFGNGAGSIKRLDEVKRAAKSAMTRITVGSITAEPRDGNIGQTYYFDAVGHWSLNSLGLPNPGIAVYDRTLPQMVQIAHDAGKQLWASIAPFTPEECGMLAERCFDAGVDGVEINGSCPNVWKGSERKTIPALDPTLAGQMFAVLHQHVGTKVDDTSFKLSPTEDDPLLTALAAEMLKARIRRLVCCNAKADQERKKDDGGQALAFRTDENDQVVKHKGGLAGSGVAELNWQVETRMHELMPEAEIIGVGGIFSGVDAKVHLSNGATGFQSTTGYLEFGEKLFQDIVMELV